ncbi:MAG: hypothetical protein ABIX28_19920 [Vicinamibacterales bacterium]
MSAPPARALRSLLVPLLAGVIGCAAPGPPRPAIQITSTAGGAVIEITGLNGRDRAALRSARLSDDEWAQVYRVSVEPGDTAMVGRYVIDTSVQFVPAFPLDPGRRYQVTFDASRLPRTAVANIPASRATVALPAVTHVPSTIVTAVYPSGDTMPANQLRMYVQFSAPMGQQAALGQVILLDAEGREIPDALLPLDTELWDAARTRLTVLFDPGRVKREILPNRRMGRPLRVGETITLLVKGDWRDANHVPLKAEFRRTYRVGRADEAPIDVSAWTVASPSGGTRDALTVSFPEPLDYALLGRALRVVQNGAPVPGDVQIGPGETRWAFTPRDPWQASGYELLVQAYLEDPSGNRIGRAFEVRSPGDAVPAEDSGPRAIPFRPVAPSFD